MTQEDPNRPVTYSLRWPAWLADKTADAASARAQSVATWIREAIWEKHSRENGEQS